jgi:hypothetical protein
MTNDTPPVILLLGLDAEYREKAAAGKLKMVAPKKLNPEGKAWLPVMTVSREGWRFTVAYSNTQRAHELGKTHEWVVIYFNAQGGTEGSCTVVTEHKGMLKGKRVIRGREQDCEQHYAGSPPEPPAGSDTPAA